MKSDDVIFEIEREIQMNMNSALAEAERCLTTLRKCWRRLEAVETCGAADKIIKTQAVLAAKAKADKLKEFIG